MKNRPSNKKVAGLQVVEDECVWMKAGVVNFRLCDNVYDCYNCPFDKGMRIAMNRKSSGYERKRPAWAEGLRKQYPISPPCRHALTGRTDAPKTCILNYECFHCAYDQWLDEWDISGDKEIPVCKSASGYKVAEGYYYHIGHSWVLFEHGGITRVGFDDFLVKLFGRMDSVRLPSLGETLKQGEAGWAFTRDEFKASVLSPVSGKVLAVNNKVLDYPEITHKDPYQNGWLCIIEPNLPMKDIKRLYYGSDSIIWMEDESRKLMQMIGDEYEGLAATGGEPIGDIFGNCPELGWDQLVDTFLRR